MNSKASKRHSKAFCPSCDTAPLQLVEKDIITESVSDAEGNWHPRAKVIFPAYLHCAFCHSDFTLKKERL